MSRKTRKAVKERQAATGPAQITKRPSKKGKPVPAYQKP